MNIPLIKGKSVAKKRFLSIRTKLIFILILSATIALILSTVAIFFHTFNEKKNDGVRALSQMTKIMGANLIATIEFDDSDNANITLKTLELNKNIEGAFVFKDKNTVFSSYYAKNKNHQELGTFIKNIYKKNDFNKYIEYVDMNTIFIGSPIYFNNTYLGTICIVSNNDDLKSTMFKLLSIFTLIFIISLILVIISSFKIQKIFTSPIFVLKNAMEDISLNSNYDTHVKTENSDEFKILFNGFNHMIETIKESKLKQQDLIEEVKEQKEFVQTLLDSQEQIIITTTGKDTTSVNKAFLDFYSVGSIKEFEKTYNATCICDTFNTNAPDYYLQTTMDGKYWIDYVLITDKEHKVIITMEEKDYIFSVAVANLPGEDGFKSVVFTNITEMEIAKQEVEQILANILLPVLITSKKERKITYANKYAETQYETSVENIIGSNIDDIYTVQGQHHHIIDAIKRDGFIENSEENFVSASGKEFTALLSVIPITYKGVDSYIGMVADITEQKEKEKEIAEIHKHTKESIEYASLIQGALIPENEIFKKYFKDYFTIWHPKDLVGGDIYLFDELRHDYECLLMVIDCTGHGVPGAFVTMLIKAIERQVTAKINNDHSIEVSPAWILSYFNKTIKKLLKQEGKDSVSNAGFDGQILYYNKKDKIIKFASARNELLFYQNNELQIIKGDRHSVGYKDSNTSFKFKEHIIDVSVDTTMYISSDGYWDQNGGDKNFPYGKKRLKKSLDEINNDTMKNQKKELLNRLSNYQKDFERNDDVTFIGLKF